MQLEFGNISFSVSVYVYDTVFLMQSLHKDCGKVSHYRLLENISVSLALYL